MYMECPRKYWERYFNKNKGQSTPPLIIGTIAHAVMEKVANSGGEYDLRVLLNAAMAEQEIVEFADMAALWKMVEWGAATIDQSKLMVAEQPFEIDLKEAGLAITGVIDRVDKIDDHTIHVIDYKTSIHAMSSWEMETNLQLTIYYIAARALWPWATNILLSLFYLRDGIVTTVTADDTLVPFVYDYLAGIVNRIRAEQFEPKQNKYCFWCHCRPNCPLWASDADCIKGTLDYTANGLEDMFDHFRQVSSWSKSIDDLKNNLQQSLLAYLESAGMTEVAVGGYNYRRASKAIRSFDAETVAQILTRYSVSPFSVMNVGAKKLDDHIKHIATEHPEVKQLVDTAVRMVPTASWIEAKAQAPKARSVGN